MVMFDGVGVTQNWLQDFFRLFLPSPLRAYYEELACCQIESLTPQILYNHAGAPSEEVNSISSNPSPAGLRLSPVHPAISSAQISQYLIQASSAR